MSDSKGVYIVTIEDIPDTGGRTLVNRFEETDEVIDTLALRLEALVEAGFIGGFTIKGQDLPPYETPTGLYTSILSYFWHFPESNEAKDGVDAILYDERVREYGAAWEQGWRNRDAYFQNTAKRNIK